jgi:tRNA uridine 5-carboxymethylaminomethyl modification enzyme
LVREVDALGGLIGKITDKAAVAYRFLNRSKGKAVWATRVQVDKYLYPKIAREFLENTKNLTILQAKVKCLIVKNKKFVGIETNFGQMIEAGAAIICAGTFLKSTIHIGLNSFSGGRLGEESSDELFESIRKLKITTKHFKTGTCARLDKRSIDFLKMQEQVPDTDVIPFSFSNSQILTDQLSCYITRTNKKTHKIILANLNRSPLYTGKIKAHGVRYCPSLEDKIVRFGDREGHHIFIEPEGRDTNEVYPNGISTSLPLDAQIDFIHTIEGLEKAVVLRPGYGIEHGLIDARELDANLEAKKVGGLFFAGQVNGTTGYEEAAAQGFIAGVNAVLAVKGKKPLVLKREEAFIGVLIDDLTAKGTDEPYRMFTSRSEFRLSVRESNAIFRLSPLALKLKLIDKNEYERVLARQEEIKKTLTELAVVKVAFEGKKISLREILKRPNISFENIEKDLADKNISGSPLGKADGQVKIEAEIEVKYEAFLRREKVWQAELKHLERIKIPKMDFTKVPSLSKEVVEKLTKFKPGTLAEALRISGITPAAILAIYSFIKRR